MLRCFFRLKVQDKNDDNYDKKLILLKIDQPIDESKTSYADFLEPISPCARKLLHFTYSHLIVKFLLKYFGNVTHSSVDDHPSLQDLVLERHLILLISLRVLRKLEIVSFNYKGESASNTLEFYRFYRVDFTGYQPSKAYIPEGNRLYVPISTQYPEFDFVYFDIHLNTAFFVNLSKQKDAFNNIVASDEKAKKQNRIKSAMSVGEIIRSTASASSFSNFKLNCFGILDLEKVFSARHSFFRRLLSNERQFRNRSD